MGAVTHPDETEPTPPLAPQLAGPLSESPSGLVVRHPDPDDEPLRRAAVDASFGTPLKPTSAEEADLSERMLPAHNRSLVAEVGPDGVERILGGAARLDTSLSLPGGGRVPVAGLTSVGVAPGAHGRGAFRALLEDHLNECRERGDAASVLMASEAPLYGRFGYGLATRSAAWEVDAHVARRLRPDAPTSGQVTLEPGRGPELGDLLHEVRERSGTRRAGLLTRSPAWWERVLGPTQSWMGGGPLLVALHWNADGECDGYLMYDVDFRHGRQANAESTITLRELVAPDVAVELDLWRFAAGLPWARELHWPHGPVDPAPLFWMDNTRALRRMWQADFLWMRPLDLTALTEQRRFAADGAVALHVNDPVFDDLGGRFDLRVRGGAGQWVPAKGPAELQVSIADLGELWLGDVSARRLVGVHRITGDPAAAGRLDAMLATDAAPRSLARF